MNTNYLLSSHARERSQQRRIPQGIIDLILDFGDSTDAGYGARRHYLSRRALRGVRQYYGRGVAQALMPFRGAYVIASGATVITSAFQARRPVRRSRRG